MSVFGEEAQILNSEGGSLSDCELGSKAFLFGKSTIAS